VSVRRRLVGGTAAATKCCCVLRRSNTAAAVSAPKLVAPAYGGRRYFVSPLSAIAAKGGMLPRVRRMHTAWRQAATLYRRHQCVAAIVAATLQTAVCRTGGRRRKPSAVGRYLAATRRSRLCRQDCGHTAEIPRTYIQLTPGVNCILFEESCIYLPPDVRQNCKF
jgi:hypothetical protein